MSLSKSEALRDAELRIRQGQTAEAIGIYKKIIEADPFDLTTIGALSQLYVKTGRIQDAIDDFSRIADDYLDKGSPIKSAYMLKKILELDPSNATAHARLGEIYKHEGMSEKAYEAFLTAGVVFAKKGNAAEALEANKKALAVKPDSRQAATAISSLQTTGPSKPDGSSNQPTPHRLDQRNAGQPGEPDQTRKPASAGAGHAPAGFDDSVLVQQISMAEFLVGYGKVEQAIEMLKDIINHRPDHIDVRVKLKDIYLRSEMMEKASAECFEIASIYASRGDMTRARDYTVRAQRLTQLFKQPDPPRQVTSPKAAPQAVSKPSGDLIVKKEEAETGEARSKIESTEGRAGLKAAPAVARVAEPAAPLKLVVEKTALAERPKADDLKIEASDTALVLATKEERGLAAVTAQAPVASSNFPSATLGLMLAQPASEPETKTKTRRWLYAAVIALAVLGVIAAAIFKGVPSYEARLDREYQALAQANPLPAMPQPQDAAPVEEPEPVEQMEVRASDYPAAQPNKPARDEEGARPESNATTPVQPSQPSIAPPAASEPPKANKTPQPAPPLMQSAPNPQGGVGAATPGGVPTSTPGSAAGAPEPEPPPAARQPGATVKGEAIKKVQPDYPLIARSTAQSGMVSVEVTVSEKGDVIAARAMSGPQMLRDAAVSAARRWKFKPSMRDSKPVVSTSVISFNFKL
ncbi:MAG TPA: TonB family protein [Blastocatellia bacterium]|nr:TonB family protein [Blastocatellia bacterium]